MSAGSSNHGKALKVLQFTDTHFFKDSNHKLLGVDTAASFADVYKKAMSQHGKPDFYLLTGDLSQDETESSYGRLSEAMAQAGAPCYFLPGNHDRRHEMASGLLHDKSPFKADRRIQQGNWEVILLDSLVEGEVGGHLADSQLDFLEKSLSEKAAPHALVCLHHHPVAMGARWLDQIGVDNGEQFMSIIDKYDAVKAVLWGHVHQKFEKKRGNKMLMATPSTCVQFKCSNEFGVDALPPGYRYIELGADGSIHTEVVRTDKVAVGLELSSAGY
jgi:Icc protein